jgi:YVTN family beta-propeller protein
MSRSEMKHLGERPRDVAVDSRTHRVYVANTHSNNVTVIDGTLNSLVATVNTGNGPLRERN